MKHFIRELKEFAVKGNVVDLAVGVIIGGAFGKVVSSLVSDIIMPPIGLLVGGMKFTDIVITLKKGGVNAAGTIVPAVTMNIGNFIQNCFDFLIVALAIFAMIKLMNRIRKQKPVEEKETPRDIQLLTEIRDLLKK
jgi:large conductance mechanosensitive channel